MTKLCSELNTWLPAICRDNASIDKYQALLIRQLKNAESGDITTADFYSIFYRSERK